MIWANQFPSFCCCASHRLNAAKSVVDSLLGVAGSFDSHSRGDSSSGAAVAVAVTLLPVDAAAQVHKG